MEKSYTKSGTWPSDGQPVVTYWKIERMFDEQTPKIVDILTKQGLARIANLQTRDSEERPWIYVWTL